MVSVRLPVKLHRLGYQTRAVPCPAAYQAAPPALSSLCGVYPVAYQAASLVLAPLVGGGSVSTLLRVIARGHNRVEFFERFARAISLTGGRTQHLAPVADPTAATHNSRPGC